MWGGAYPDDGRKVGGSSYFGVTSFIGLRWERRFTDKNKMEEIAEFRQPSIFCSAKSQRNTGPGHRKKSEREKEKKKTKEDGEKVAR